MMLSYEVEFSAVHVQIYWFDLLSCPSGLLYHDSFDRSRIRAGVRSRTKASRREVSREYVSGASITLQ